jgi:hypothetical protein
LSLLFQSDARVSLLDEEHGWSFCAGSWCAVISSSVGLLAARRVGLLSGPTVSPASARSFLLRSDRDKTIDYQTHLADHVQHNRARRVGELPLHLSAWRFRWGTCA